MFITFLQQIIVLGYYNVIGGQKSSFIGKFKLEPITIYHFDLLWKCCENYFGQIKNNIANILQIFAFTKKKKKKNPTK